MKINVFNFSGDALKPWDFSEKVLGNLNPKLLAQALRIYSSNSHQKTHKVKSRGEVDGSTRKIYRQKGTGNARHGAKYAPIFVGGGIAHGPTGDRPENLILPKKMKRKALASALLLKMNQSELHGFAGTNLVSGKTSAASKFLTTVAHHPQSSVLLVTQAASPKLLQMVGNLQGVTLKRANLVNAYDLISHDKVVLTKKALDSIVARSSL